MLSKLSIARSGEDLGSFFNILHTAGSIVLTMGDVRWWQFQSTIESIAMLRRKAYRICQIVID